MSHFLDIYSFIRANTSYATTALEVFFQSQEQEKQLR